MKNKYIQQGFPELKLPLRYKVKELLLRSKWFWQTTSLVKGPQHVATKTVTALSLKVVLKCKRK